VQLKQRLMGCFCYTVVKIFLLILGLYRLLIVYAGFFFLILVRLWKNGWITIVISDL